MPEPADRHLPGDGDCRGVQLLGDVDPAYAPVARMPLDPSVS
ncbi:MAG TPA: hypothetical protein VMU32_11725 [Solirubrobacteraceae bacterium]|nr:hypothetical protein [Solirubrobacteraceae bacterium]